MLIFDQLKKNDPQLRLLAVGICGGLVMLLAGLWWVQVVKAREYQTNLETQSFRTVRLPSVRGKILDRNGNVLAENRPTYNVSLYLEDLRRQFVNAYTNATARVRAQRVKQMAEVEKKLGRELTKRERKQYALSRADKSFIGQTTRLAVANDVVTQISTRLRHPLSLDPTNFTRHYETRLALPYPVLKNIDAAQVARFEEQFADAVGADLEIQSTRVYPFDTVASHVLGYLRRDDSSMAGEEAFFSYRLPDFRGVVGVEGGFDTQLRGRAGAKSVLVNNLGYRQTENIWSAAEPGHNVVLTLDLRIQQAAERAMYGRLGPQARGAVVVMDVHSGDILALASSPTVNPNDFVRGFTPAEMARLNDATMRPQINRATQENYAPGSIFKPIVGLACLEAGLNPKQAIYNPGHYYVGRRYINDLAPAGDYDFRRAIVRSSNTYFISNGLRFGCIEKIIALGQQLHLGERSGLPTRQETAGHLPSLERIRSGWFDGDTANICIGQGAIDVTPLQVAVMTSALANGGKVLWPRLVQRIESQDSISTEPPAIFPAGRVRNQLSVSARNLKILCEAMLDETENPEGTGTKVSVPGLRICGKTGTAQVTDQRNQVVGHNLWFISFAPYEKPRYAVVVMAEGAGTGGGTCAPLAHDIYTAIQKLDGGTATATLARGN